MFDYLNTIPATRAVSCIYEAIRLIKHRLTLQDFEPLSQDERVAWQIIEEIQNKAEVQLSDLDESRAEAYVVELARRGQETIAKERPHNQARGRQLLEAIRKSSSRASTLVKPVNLIADQEDAPVRHSRNRAQSKTLTHREVESAFRLAYYIHPNRAVALNVTLGACNMLSVAKRNLERKDPARSYKQRIPDDALLQMFVYDASDAEERKQEVGNGNGEALYEPTHDDLLIRYIKFLIWKTLIRNPLWLGIGLGCFLYTYRPGEIARLLDFEESNSRRVKARIAQSLEARFKRTTVARNKKILFRQPNEYEHMLVHNSLYMFTPWLPPEAIVPPTKKRLLSTYFGFLSQKTDWERSYVLIDPTNAGLAHLIREHNEAGPEPYDEPESRLKIPTFKNVRSGLVDRFDLTPLRDHEVTLIQRFSTENRGGSRARQ